MRWTMHFKLNPDLSMLLYLALSIKLLKDCESRSSLLVSSPGEGKAKQSEAKQVHSSPKRRRDTGDTGDTRDINASVPCPIRQVSLHETHVDAVSALKLSSASGASCGCASCAQTRIGSISLERSSLEWMEPRQTKAAKIQNDNELKIIKMSSWFNLDCD